MINTCPFCFFMIFGCGCDRIGTGILEKNCILLKEFRMSGFFGCGLQGFYFVISILGFVPPFCITLLFWVSECFIDVSFFWFLNFWCSSFQWAFVIRELKLLELGLHFFIAVYAISRSGLDIGTCIVDMLSSVFV